MRVRKKISGTGERPRMSIMTSNKHMYVQFINDDKEVTLASASTLATKGGRPKTPRAPDPGPQHAGNNIAAARLLGRRVAEAALKKGIKNIVIDRGGCKFHGRVKAVTDAVIEAGLQTSTRAARQDREKK